LCSSMSETKFHTHTEPIRAQEEYELFFLHWVILASSFPSHTIGSLPRNTFLKPPQWVIGDFVPDSVEIC
jgi:hypothetical protein